MHDDIKPANVFLVENVSDSLDPGVKIGDFGSAQPLYDGESPSFHDGHLIKKSTPRYCPPEFGLDTLAKDVWAIGCVIFAMARLSQPPTSKSPLGRCRHVVYETMKGTWDFATELQTEAERKQVIEFFVEHGDRMRAPINFSCKNSKHRRHNNLPPAPAYSDALNSLLMLCWEGDYRARIKADRLAAVLDSASIQAINDLASGTKPEWNVTAQGSSKSYRWPGAGD